MSPKILSLMLSQEGVTGGRGDWGTGGRGDEGTGRRSERLRSNFLSTIHYPLFPIPYSLYSTPPQRDRDCHYGTDDGIDNID